MDSNILEKLKKILALAERGATEGEMQAAMAKAQQLAIEHNIDLGSIQLDTGKAPTIETDKNVLKSEASGQWRPHHDALYRILKACFQVEMIKTTWHDGKAAQAVIVGEKTDVAIATYVWHWLDGLFPKLHRAYCNNLGISHTPADTAVRRRSYYDGLEVGIISTNRRAVRAMDQANADKYAIVLVKKEEVVQARYKDEFPHVKKGSTRVKQTHDGAYYAGAEKGRTIKLNGGLTEGSKREKLT